MAFKLNSWGLTPFRENVNPQLSKLWCLVKTRVDGGEDFNKKK